MAFESNTIENIMIGDGNIFAVIGRVTRALKDSGMQSEELSMFRSGSMRNFQSYSEALHFCMDALVKAGFKWGARELEKQELITSAVLSGKYDDVTIAEMKKRLNID